MFLEVLFLLPAAGFFEPDFFVVLFATCVFAKQHTRLSTIHTYDKEIMRLICYQILDMFC